MANLPRPIGYALAGCSLTPTLTQGKGLGRAVAVCENPYMVTVKRLGTMRSMKVRQPLDPLQPARVEAMNDDSHPLWRVRHSLGNLSVGLHGTTDHLLPEEVEVWLRKPPRLDALVERVHELMDQQGLSYRDAAKVLPAEGKKVNSGNVWYSYRRYYDMRDLPVPKRPYNNGRPRKSA